MPDENVNIEQNQDGGVPQQPQEQEVPVESVEETTEEKKIDESPVSDEDRSAFNCPDCKGEGVTFPPTSPEGLICSTCKGTGKV